MSASAGSSVPPRGLRFFPGFRRFADERSALQSEVAFLHAQLTRLRARTGIPDEPNTARWNGSDQSWPHLRADGAAPASCKICGALALERLRLPRSKLPYRSIPDAPSDCLFHECTRCHFLFTTLLDDADHPALYDGAYWNADEGAQRIPQALRLAAMAATMIGRPLWELDILDFGCGTGSFVRTGRNDLGLKLWGTDINTPENAGTWYLPSLAREFDAIIACEVIEHIPDPVATFRTLRKSIRPGGVFAFQTAEYAPGVAHREWDYLGPGHGHVSHYSRAALTHLFHEMGGMRRMLWNGYAGIQAWQF
jgi:SAM-dependent methyltransferase